MPHLQDPDFNQSLIYILEHNEDGAFGVVINQTAGLVLDDVLQQLDIKASDNCDVQQPVLNGGPVYQQHGLVLHCAGPSFESTREFSGGLCVSSSRDVLEALATGQEPVENQVLLGHAGWTAAQLEAEVANNAWITCAAESNIIFSTPLEQRRDAVAKMIGFEWHTVVGQSGHA